MLDKRALFMDEASRNKDADVLQKLILSEMPEMMLLASLDQSVVFISALVVYAVTPSVKYAVSERGNIMPEEQFATLLNNVREFGVLAKLWPEMTMMCRVQGKTLYCDTLMAKSRLSPSMIALEVSPVDLRIAKKQYALVKAKREGQVTKSNTRASYADERRSKLMRAHLCTSCGKHPVSVTSCGASTRCEHCLAVSRMKARNKYRNEVGIPADTPLYKRVRRVEEG